MKKLVFVIFSVVLIAGCNNTGKKLVMLQAERDSLLTVMAEQDSAKAVMDSYMETIALTLDSIKMQEGILTLRVDPETGRKYSSREIRENLEKLQEIIHRQRERITELELQVLDSPDSTRHYREVITYLREQISEKESQISQLQQMLRERDARLREMGRKVDHLTSETERLTAENSLQAETIGMQHEIMTVQDNAANTGYVLIASRKDLRNKNILAHGKINYSNLDTSDFSEVDMREFREITIMSGKAKILSAMPATSYSLSKTDKQTSQLVISDPGTFWSVSSYLIIQTD